MTYWLMKSEPDAYSIDDRKRERKEPGDGMRNYQAGDSLRRIHWAKYARTGKLHSKVFVDYQQHDLWLAWEDLPSGGVEQRLSHLCARVLELEDKQQTYGLSIPGTTIRPNTGEAHRVSCLTALALYSPGA